MNYKKFDKKLFKLQNFYQSVKIDMHMTAIEKNLLKQYISELYEVVIDDSMDVDNPSVVESSAPRTVVAPIPEQPKQKTKVAPQPMATPAPAPEEVDYTFEVPEAPAHTSWEATQNYVPPVTAAPSVERIVQQEIVNKTTEVNETFSDPAPTHYAPPVEKAEIPEEIPAAKPSFRFVNPDLAKIFAVTEITDLSDRLSNARIDDLHRAFGINEKILTVKELFDGDSDLFTRTMDRLNSFSNYDHAQEYLANGVALDKNWLAPEKINKAKVFVKTVQRRYA